MQRESFVLTAWMQQMMVVLAVVDGEGEFAGRELERWTRAALTSALVGRYTVAWPEPWMNSLLSY